MRPVSIDYDITQGFGSLPTRGVVGNINGSMVQMLVALYGHYQEDGHAGADIGCPVGTPVRAVRSGTVIWCDWDVNLPGGPNSWSIRWFFYQHFGGRLLLIQHAPDDIDVYAHLSAWKVRRGQFVNEGDLVALSGDSSGGQDGVLGPHLHCERIVDLTYPTSNGLIYGRTDPTTVWGGISAQGTITEEDDFMALFKDIAEFKAAVAEAVEPAHATTRKSTAYNVMREEVPYLDPTTGKPAGTTSLYSMVGAQDLQHVATRRTMADGAKAIIDAVSASYGIGAAKVADDAYNAFLAKLDNINLSITPKEK